MGVLHINLKVGHPKIISTQISEQKILFKSSPLKALNQIKSNLAGMVLGWSPFNIVSDCPALHSRWLLLLKFSIWHLKLIDNGGVTHNFESGPPKDHFNSNLWSKDLDVIGFVTRLTRRVLLVEQEFVTLPEQLSPPSFEWGWCYLMFSFMYCFVNEN
jgi:hypothetical protein